MRLFPEKLAAQLADRLAPVYLVAGQEPLLIEESCDAIRQAARRNEIGERKVLEADARFDWQGLDAATETASLFATRRLVEVRIANGKPGRQGAAALREWVARGGDDLLLIKCDAWELKSEKTAWFRDLEQAGVYVPCWRVKSERLPQWLAMRMKSRGLSADRAVIDFLAQRLEGNLLAAAQEVERLKLLFGANPVNLEAVRQAVADSARFDSFRLVELVLLGRAGAALRCIRMLRGAGVAQPAIVFALASELVTVDRFRQLARRMPAQQAFAELRVWQGRQPAVSAAASRFDSTRLGDAFAALSRLDLMAKGQAEGNFWLALERLCVALAADQPARLAS